MCYILKMLSSLIWTFWDAEESDEELVETSDEELVETSSLVDERDANTPDDWIMRDFTMVRLTGDHPFNAEPPVRSLMKDFYTPVKEHYVRNHGSVPQIAWKDHKIELKCGDRLVHRMSMAELTSMKPIRIPVTLSCAGNRRKEQNQVKKSLGFDWGSCAVATSVWTGVYLIDILGRYNMVPDYTERPYFVVFEGVGDLTNGKYGTSVPIEELMDPTREAIVAYKQDDELLTPDHGYPVRMIIPGYIGGRMVKWLDLIKISEKESSSYYHFHDNRVLPSRYDEFLLESKPELWRSPNFVIYDRNINSVVTSPGQKEVLVIGTGGSSYAFKGYAYAGGGKRVTRVELSFDNGTRWIEAEITGREPPTRYGKHWCWVHWTVEIELKKIVASKGVYVRAWDSMMNTQPKDIIWNVLGMMNNSWYRVSSEIEWLGRGLAVKFVHPVSVSGDCDGWMGRGNTSEIRQVKSSHELSLQHPVISVDELSRHDSEESCWIQIGDGVYDVTKWLKRHPGGKESILNVAGADCSEDFYRIHSNRALRMLKKWQVGRNHN